jgi:hypothetical protein
VASRRRPVSPSHASLAGASNGYRSRRAITRTITQPVTAKAATAPTKEASSPVSDIVSPRCHACTIAE